MAVLRILAVLVLAQWIQLTVVADFSCESGMFGDSCSYSCHCGTSCDVTTGACSGDCDTGWRKAGGLCQKQNIALNKTASTTSGQFQNWSPSNAVDGDSSINGLGKTCFHARRSPSDWTVDLGQDFQLYDIRIYSRNTFYFRNANSNIYLNNDPSSICATLPGTTTNPVDVTCNGTGRYVTIRKLGPGGQEGHDSALNICEVEIYVCSPGIYGANCDKFCHCLDSACDRLTGLCAGDCRPGWQDQRCDTACNSVTYGINCMKTCAERKCSVPNSPCDRHTGACDTGCLPGWTEDDCTQVPVNCPPGRYGPECTEFCSSRSCKTPSSVCDVTGSCPDGCREGWQTSDCIIPCQSGRYGSNCSKSCDSRHCQTAPVSCDHVTGACAAGCQEGWIGADCTLRCKRGTYGPDCTRCGHCDVTCNIGDGRCPGQCLDGFTGDRCDEDVRVSPVTSGVIGGAVVLVVMLLLIGGLTICLLKSGRLKWISSPSTGVRNKNTGDTGEIPVHANTYRTNEQDYIELSDVTREREEKSQYDVIQNKVYENSQI
ncbi:multiple epidermal growth factor-like domains protein 10 [Haliotis asinina]|uniref:multiple epidermal growth factor-like domains protein 10 n=1 Tax=Haliotis asinina TaxID=109174 RepID=UPI003531873F